MTLIKTFIIYYIGHRLQAKKEIKAMFRSLSAVPIVFILALSFVTSSFGQETQVTPNIDEVQVPSLSEIIAEISKDVTCSSPVKCTADIQRMCHPQTGESTTVPSTCSCGIDASVLMEQGWVYCHMPSE